MENSDHIVVFCTCLNQVSGKEIANALVGEKLAACVNIIPAVESVYTWKGEICRDSEILLIIKTRTELFTELENRIKSLHSCDVPEIIAFPVQKGSLEYLKWIDDTTAR